MHRINSTYRWLKPGVDRRVSSVDCLSVRLSVCLTVPLSTAQRRDHPQRLGRCDGFWDRIQLTGAHAQRSSADYTVSPAVRCYWYSSRRRRCISRETLVLSVISKHFTVQRQVTFTVASVSSIIRILFTSVAALFSTSVMNVTWLAKLT